MENEDIAVSHGGAARNGLVDEGHGVADTRGLPVDEDPVYMDLVVRCATTDLSAHRIAMVHNLATRVADWRYVLQMASFHGVLPLVAKGLLSAGVDRGGAPIPLLVGRVCRDVAARNLAFASEQQRILNVFAADSIPGIPFKGAVLAQMAYGSLGLRSCTDIDILIPADKYRKAENALLADGFRVVGRARDLQGFRRTLYLALSRQSTFVRGSVALDLHVGIMPPGYRFAPTFDELMERAVVVAAGGVPFRTFSPEDLLLILCFHGVKNRWEVLKHYCDVAELIRSHPQLDWDLAIGRARRTSATRILRLGVHLAHKLLDAPLPAAVASWCERDRGVEPLENQLLGGLVRTHQQRLSPGERFRFHLTVQDTVSTRARYCVYALARRASATWVPEDV